MPRIFAAIVLAVATSALAAQCQSPGSYVETTASNQSPAPMRPAEQTSGFSEQLFTNAQGKTMRYLLFVPERYSKQQKYPMVLWLHGGGSRGADLKLLNAYGNQHGIGYLARPDNQSRYPSFIVAPQCPQNKFWGDSDSEQPTAEMKLVLEILDQLQKDFSIDANRLYAMGISLGGYGTWDIITRRPEMFAAAVPICGGSNPAKASLVTKTAIWAFHGDRDELVNVNESRSMIAALRKAGLNPRYTEYKDVGHNAWERAFAERDFLQWLFAQKRP